MAPIFARFPAIKVGISRSRWDALLRKAEHRVSLSVRRITHILEWFHLSMRLRHIEQAWEGIRHLQNLDVYLQSVAVHVPRLLHLLWSGYVREASEAVKQMLAQLDQHPGFRDTPDKLWRLYELINNLGTIWGETQLRSSATVGDTGPVSRYPVRRLKVPPIASSMPV